MTDYAELRTALDQTCHALLIDDPDTIRALLAERDALLYFAESFVEAWEEGVGGDSSIYRQAKAALAQEGS